MTGYKDVIFYPPNRPTNRPKRPLVPTNQRLPKIPWTPRAHLELRDTPGTFETCDSEKAFLEI